MMGGVRKFRVVRGIVKPTDKVPLGILPVKAVFIGSSLFHVGEFGCDDLESG